MVRIIAWMLAMVALVGTTILLYSNYVQKVPTADLQIMDKNKFLIDLAESRRTDVGKKDFKDQGEEQKVFSAIWRLESEVNNGGFAQYLTNCDSDEITFAPTALKKIGANQCANIVERVLRLVFAGEIPVEPSKRTALAATVSDKLDSHDAEFHKYPDDLTDLLHKYVTSHPLIFGSN